MPPKKRKTSAESAPAKSLKTEVKKDADDMKKIIPKTGSVDDVAEEIVAPLEDGNEKTEDAEVKPCLICHKEIVPGKRSYCNLKHDVFWNEFDVDYSPHYGCHYGTHKGAECNRCGAQVSIYGYEDLSPHDEKEGIEDCYYGGCVSSMQEMKEQLTSLRKAGCSTRDEFMDYIVEDRGKSLISVPDDVVKAWESGAKWSDEKVEDFYDDIHKYDT